MLISQGDLEVNHSFPLALESKMTWFYYSRVHGPYSYLMDFFPFYPEKLDFSRFTPVEPYRFQPGMPLGNHPQPFCQIPFEPVHTGQIWREGGIGFLYRTGKDLQSSRGGIQESAE
jgi:hypothetical protein